METLETLSKRIETTRGLESIVGTMKALAAVSIRQYEQATVALRQYSRTVDLGLRAVLHERPRAATTGKDRGASSAVIVWGSDHGLCGRFNEEIAAFVQRSQAARAAKGGKFRTIVVGRRISARLRAYRTPVHTTYAAPAGVQSLSRTAHDILLQLDRWQERDGLRSAHILHNMRTEDVLAQPVSVQLLPVDVELLDRLARQPWPSRSIPQRGVPIQTLFSDLIRQRLFITVFRAGAESLASEQASRLASMQAAQRSIQERLETMETLYSRKRQESITSELLDVVSGFEATRTPEEEQDPAEAPR